MEDAEEKPAAAATVAEKVLTVVNIHLHESQIYRKQYFWLQNLAVQARAEFHDVDEADRKTNTDD